ncbi:hypothetical protein H8D57_03900, partial [bacterium]|nr:hypothetical protein [bacterium]
MMATDYQAIRNDNIQKYGTDIERIGPMLLSDRYADSAHFIFELLQNTEDALKRRKGWDGPKSVSFDLSNDSLRVSHFGQPFTKLDVNGICGIGEGTKDITEIGEFGIGFKSVYEITNRPEIHSGEEDFAIESYVRPVAVDSISRENDQTVIILPLKERNYSTVEMITSGLNRLSLSALLFLRQIDSISWTVVGSGSGTLIRETTTLSTNVRRVELLGQIPEIDELHENWLIFSKPIVKSDKELVGHVEIAFSAERDKEKDEYRIKRVERSPLVAFFPTALETNLGFLIQGPYRTTPSRDNVPPDKPWNQQLVKETAALLIDSLKWLRKENMLNINILRCLPIHAYKFQDGNMFSPIFHATKLALLTQSLLPKLRSGFTSAQRSRLGRTQEIRDLLTSKQLADLYGESGHIAWLSADITLDRTPDLRSYLIEDLGMRELVPASVLELLDGDFLTVQTDAWIRRFYEFLNKQTGLHKRLGDLPLIRLVDGEHIAISTTTTHGVFLPGTFKSDFPTVRPTVCNTDGSREFLIAMGFHPPDPVDDVILNLLPKYNAGEIDVDEDEYTADIQRIIASFETDSKTQREKLLSTLKTSAFVMAVEGASGERYHITPDSVYIASDRLKDLFQGVADVYLIDSSYDCLHGDKARELLEACGAVRYLKPMKNDFLDWELRKEIREGTGHTESSGRNDVIVDWKIRGLDELLESLSKLDAKQRAHKAKLLWEELVQLEERRGKTIFTGEYTWTHNGSYKTNFDPSFVKKLNNTS